MPELPEVETTRRGIEPYLIGQTIHRIDVRDRRLRWPIAKNINAKLSGARIQSVDRRGKYLLCRTDRGALIIHLGMSGSLRVLPDSRLPGRHDHYDIVLNNRCTVRYNDPRRFGSLHFAVNPGAHRLLAKLGPEPFDDDFNGAYLKTQARGRTVAIKNFIMNASVVVGVGNIYASESLFKARIHPGRAAGRISAKRLQRLSESIKTVLASSIEQGGTTLRDFVGSDGSPGYFGQSLAVYDQPECPACGTAVRRSVLGQRATYHCPSCQR